MEEVTLETLAILGIGSLFFTTFIWSFFYIMMIRKFETVFKMFEGLATGIAGQHEELGENQLTMYGNISKQHEILEKSIKGEKEVFNENDYH